MCAQLCLYAVKANLPVEVRRHGATFTIATPEEILRTSLSEKLAFLETCNVRIPPGIYNPKLRNSVAHMDFTVLDDGTISYDDEQIAYDRLERLVWNTRDVFVTIQRAVANVVGEFLRRDGWRGPFPTPLPPPLPDPPECGIGIRRSARGPAIRRVILPGQAGTHASTRGSRRV